MNAKPLNILCFSENSEITRIINAVYNAAPHEINCLPASKIQEEFEAAGDHNLIIIDNSNNQVSANTIRKLQILHGSVSLILIENNRFRIDDWGELQRLHCVNSDHIANRLPLALSEAYSEITNENSDSMSYWNAIRMALYESGQVIAIVDQECKLIFLNRSGEVLLGVNAAQYAGSTLKDFITDGAKVWNYIVNKIGLTNHPIGNYQLLFLDLQNREIPRKVNIRRIDGTSNLFLIQSIVNPLQYEDAHETDYQVLNKFADSIANELLNPVNIISGRLQLLQSEAGEIEAVQKSLTPLTKQVNRISDTVSKLLTFARLKRDTIPQKIHLNEIIQRLFLDPAVNKLICDNDATVEFQFEEKIPLLAGLISHFDMMIKTLIELSIHCLGAGGRIHLQTAARKNSGQDWLDLIMTIKYPQPLFGKDETIQAYMGMSASLRRVKSLESTIVFHIILQYEGNFQVHQTEDDAEEMILSFPNPSSLQQTETK
jgi:signal transduction histidine kinase